MKIKTVESKSFSKQVNKLNEAIIAVNESDIQIDSYKETINLQHLLDEYKEIELIEKIELREFTKKIIEETTDDLRKKLDHTVQSKTMTKLAKTLQKDRKRKEE